MSSFWDLLEKEKIEQLNDDTSTLILRGLATMHTIRITQSGDIPLGIGIKEFPPICMVDDNRDGDNGDVLGEYVKHPAVVQQVRPDSPAQKAGLMPGDLLCRDDDDGCCSVASYGEMKNYLRSGDRPLMFVVKRYARKEQDNTSTDTTESRLSDSRYNSSDVNSYANNLKELAAPPSLHSLISRCKRVFGWDDALVERVRVSYVQFMKLTVSLEDYSCETFSAPRLVRDMWQQHVLDVCSYRAYCKSLCGRLILFDPDESDTCNNLAITQQFMKAKYEGSVDNDIWRGAVEVSSSGAVSLKNAVKNIDDKAPVMSNNTSRNGKRRRSDDQHEGGSDIGQAPVNLRKNQSVTEHVQLNGSNNPKLKTSLDSNDTQFSIFVRIRGENENVRFKVKPSITVCRLIKAVAKQMKVERSLVTLVRKGHEPMIDGTIASNHVKADDVFDVVMVPKQRS